MAESEARQLPDAPSVVRVSARQEAQAPPSQAGGAQYHVPAENRLLTLARRGLQDQRDLYRGPFSRQALKWDIGISTITAGLIATDRQASNALSQPQSNLSLQVSNVGLYGTMGSLGVLYVSGLASDNAHARETGLLGAEALANAMVLSGAVQFAAGRERPLEATGNGRFWRNNSLGSSFPSGHSIATWSAASVIAHEYPNRWVQILAYGAAGTVSITRYSSLQHFPADVFVGAAFGYFVGRHVFHSHCRADLSSACDAKPSKINLPAAKSPLVR
jgi:membrane-associated phospholipid phosphatase